VNSSSPTVGYVYDAVLSLALALNQTISNKNVSLLNESIATLRQVLVESLDQLEPFQGASVSECTFDGLLFIFNFERP